MTDSRRPALDPQRLSISHPGRHSPGQLGYEAPATPLPAAWEPPRRVKKSANIPDEKWQDGYSAPRGSASAHSAMSRATTLGVSSLTETGPQPASTKKLDSASARKRLSSSPGLATW